MPASSKKERSNPAKPRTKPSAKRSSAPGNPSLRFYYSEALLAKTLAVLSTVEKAKDKTAHRDALAGIVVELTDSGMEYYFLRPLKIVKSGFLTEQSARLGMSATTSVLGSVVRNIIGRMDAPQLLSVCSYVRQLMK
jgi:hypothetical protein